MLIYLSMTASDADKTKFEIIYNEYRDLMFFVANKILNNQQDSEDVIHQAFIKIIDVLEKIDEPKCPKTRGLVVTIVERKAIDLYREKNEVLPSNLRRNTIMFLLHQVWMKSMELPTWRQLLRCYPQGIVNFCC